MIIINLVELMVSKLLAICFTSLFSYAYEANRYVGWCFASHTQAGAVSPADRPRLSALSASAQERMKEALHLREKINVSLRQATRAKTAFLANMSHGTPFRRHPTRQSTTPHHSTYAILLSLHTQSCGRRCTESLVCRNRVFPMNVWVVLMWGWLDEHDAAMAKDLMEMPLEQAASESARVISDCADHLLGLVNDILDFARIETKYVRSTTSHLPLQPTGWLTL